MITAEDSGPLHIRNRRCTQCRRQFPIGHYADVTGYRVVCRSCQRQRNTVQP